VSKRLGNVRDTALGSKSRFHVYGEGNKRGGKGEETRRKNEGTNIVYFSGNAAWGVIWSIFNIVAYLLVVLTMMRVTSNFLLKMIIYKGNACLHTYVLHRGESTSIVRYGT
jgi:hypothetical protein